MSESSKIVVFDLDETLGNFVEFGMFCDALENHIGKKLSNEEFFETLDIFPEFLQKIMIYTNNQGPKSWAEKIGYYFDHKIGKKIFDQIIAAFKVHGKVVEICRTSHDKSVKDLLKCTRIPSETQICFLDDQYHPLMKHSNVYYINVKPYTYNMKFQDMAERYYDKMNIQGNKDMFMKSIVGYMKQFSFTFVAKDEIEEKVDEVISKKIILHLEDFFNNHNKKRTRRNRHKKNKTRKKF